MNLEHQLQRKFMTLFRKICPGKASTNRKNVPFASGLEKEKKRKVATESIKGKNYHLKYIPTHVRNELTFESYYLLIGKSQSRWNQLIYNYRITTIQTKINSFARYNFVKETLPNMSKIGQEAQHFIVTGEFKPFPEAKFPSG